MPAEQAPRVICLGDAAVDVFVSMDEGAVKGSDAGGVVRFAPGGSAANVAVWLARLGADAAFVGAIGDDFAGAFLRADLEREGVHAHLMRVPAASAAIAVLLDEHGERTMITDRAGAVMLSPGFVDTHIFSPGCHLHLPAYSLFEQPLDAAAMAAIERCRAAGGTVGVDTSSVGPLQAFGRDRFIALLDTISPDMLFANAAEGEFSAGPPTPIPVHWPCGVSCPLSSGNWAPAARRRATIGSSACPESMCRPWTHRRRRRLRRVLHALHVAWFTTAESLDRANRLAAAVVQYVGARPRLARISE